MRLKLERDRLLVRKHRVGPRFTGAASGDRAYSIFEKRVRCNFFKNVECQTLWKVVGGTAVHLAVRTRCRHSFPAPPDSWVHFSRSNTPFSPTCIKWSIKTGQQVAVFRSRKRCSPATKTFRMQHFSSNCAVQIPTSQKSQQQKRVFSLRWREENKR